jgi:hypothetical protein
VKDVTEALWGGKVSQKHWRRCLDDASWLVTLLTESAKTDLRITLTTAKKWPLSRPFFRNDGRLERPSLSMLFLGTPPKRRGDGVEMQPRS